ncbi:MAG: NAD(P)H-hydrate epimerase [Planctomycetota bacterium]|nr:NAD(P)H-hydrate epimerase [Planctomycetota bacterium]
MTTLRLTRRTARAIDARAADEYGIPSLVLMEHAGRSAAELVLALARNADTTRAVTVFCGGGNNGGDGFVVARFLDALGVEVECVCCADLASAEGDALIERRIAHNAGLMLGSATNSAELALRRERLLADRRERVIVDALLGTGFQGVLKPHAAEVIGVVNELRAAQRGSLVVSLDLPSGLDCDSGELADPTVRADFTATFVAEKQGFLNPRAAAVLGRVVVLGIGLPRALLERVSGSAP